MLIAKKYEVPNSCPVNCKFKNDLAKYGQGSICVRCPVFACPEMISPGWYREDWAKVWYDWFKGDMQQLPELFFC